MTDGSAPYRSSMRVFVEGSVACSAGGAKGASTRGAQTPKPGVELIRARLKLAEQMEKET